jgi:hypothetical protein
VAAQYSTHVRGEREVKVDPKLLQIHLLRWKCSNKRIINRM